MSLPSLPVDLSRTSLDKDPIWHVQLVVLLALILQLTLPDKFVAGPHIVLPLLEGFLIVTLYFASRKINLTHPLFRRFNSLTLIFFIAVANVYALQQLAHILLAGGRVADGHGLILTAVNIFLTNIIVFALLYWETDGGGPVKRALIKDLRTRDFAFLQMMNPELAVEGWRPNFVDYLYVSATNATAFSPTDTLPVSRTAKLFMLAQSLVSLTTLALVASRAVNILK